jgi:uncharacterized repeat protein (TIGR03803 family)
MKTHINKLFLLPALIAGLGLLLTGRMTAQTFTNLYDFTNGTDGSYPWCGLVLSGNTLYGTAVRGGTNSVGTVFAVNTNGTSFTNLYTFTLDGGCEPYAGLILLGGTLYGTVYNGGKVFAISTNGLGFTNLYNFTNGTDGYFPNTSLILSSNTLYGTAQSGGEYSQGTVFAVNTNGSNFVTLHSFMPLNSETINSDGAYSEGTLILSGNTLYGTAELGGTNGYGTVFAINTENMIFTNLYNFTGGSDGAYPWCGLVLSGNTLYGTTQYGGTNGNGNVFAISTNGTSVTNLYSFTGGNDGSDARAGLVLSGNTLYGTASGGGSSGNGTVFAVITNGMGFTTLYGFTNGSDGADPQAVLILSDNTLYGTASKGGINGNGTVFSLSLGAVSVSPPQLTIIPSGTNVILMWPTNATGFSLESTTNLVSSAVWITNSSAPVVVNTNNAVTNGISGTKKFYRLSQ